MIRQVLLGAAGAAAAMLLSRCSHPAPPAAAELQQARAAATSAQSQDQLDRAVARAGDRATTAAVRTLHHRPRGRP